MSNYRKSAILTEIATCLYQEWRTSATFNSVTRITNIVAHLIVTKLIIGKNCFQGVICQLS